MTNKFKYSGKSKGQSAGSAAAFIAILTVIMILYILFLPPDIRDDILNGDSGGSGSGGSGTGGNYIATTTELLNEQIGKIDYITDNDKVYDLSSIRLYSPTSGQIIKATPSISVVNGLFDKENSAVDVDFEIDKDITDNVLLSFNIKESVGPVKIYLNGDQIYSGEFETSNPKPIILSKNDLNSKNSLTFKSMDPGWIFWRTNRLVVENIQITGDVTDFSRSKSTQYFSVSNAEKNNLETVKLFFTPSCQLDNAGILSIELNNRIIYSSVADCGVRSSATLDKGNIISENNEIIFATKGGAYLLDNIYLIATFDEPTYNTYFFDMGADYFLTETERARCGDIDDECPPGCSDTRDADCCVRHNGFWCGLPTYNPNDRCVYYVDENDCDQCPTGYYDKYDDPAENCEEKCGDNNDGICPSDCPGQAKYYDADCCYEENPDYFYCQEVPITGLADKCKASVRPSDCNLCPSDYKDEDGRKADACRINTYEPTYYEDALIEDYDLELTVRFVDDTERKRVDININGYKVSIDTSNIEYTKIIDEYVRKGTNTIEIVPREDITIAEITVDAIRVK